MVKVTVRVSEATTPAATVNIAATGSVTSVTFTGYSAGKQYTASDTVDILLAGAGDWFNGLRGKVLVQALVMDLKQ